MKKSTKKRKTIDLQDYIYIRVGIDTKNRIKSIAERSGANMTIWARQVLIKALEESN